MRTFEGILFLLVASSTTALQPMVDDNRATITGLYRHAVKGLSADSLARVHIANAYDTFPDDRRFALLYDKNAEKWREQEEPPEWLHKENFLCAFTNPKLMAQYEVSYQILPAESQDDETRRLLELRARASQEIVWGPEDLATVQGRTSLGDFFSRSFLRNVYNSRQSATEAETSIWKYIIRVETAKRHAHNSSGQCEHGPKCRGCLSSVSQPNTIPSKYCSGWVGTMGRIQLDWENVASPNQYWNHHETLHPVQDGSVRWCRYRSTRS